MVLLTLSHLTAFPKFKEQDTAYPVAVRNVFRHRVVGIESHEAAKVCAGLNKLAIEHDVAKQFVLI